MFSSRLFWRITFNFALLLFLLSMMTLMTLSILGQIEKSYTQASIDMSTIIQLDRLKELLADIKQTNDVFIYTGAPEKKLEFTDNLKKFEQQVNDLQKVFLDSVGLSYLNQIQTLVFNWVNEIGEKKIEVYLSDLSADKLSQEIKSIGQRELSTGYLESARSLINSLYQHRITAVPISMNYSIDLTKRITTSILIFNIMLAIFAIALGAFLTRSITKPVEQLRNGTQNIIKGVFEPITLKRKDELGELANDFNHMSKMLQQNYRRQVAYSELMTELNKHESLNYVQKASLEILCMHVKASVGALFVLEEESGVLKLASGFALKKVDQKFEYKIGEGIPGQCAEMKKNIEVKNDGTTSDFIIGTGFVDVIPPYLLASPILFQENLIGVVVIGSMQPFDEIQYEIINNSVPQIGIAITNAMNMEATKKLSQEIAMKNAELQKAYRVKSDFLSNMSHELRTPLNSIIGFTSVLLGPHSDPLTDEQKKALEKVLKNGKHLLELINDILDFSKIESGKVTVNVDSDEISNIISNAMVSIEPIVMSKGVKLVQDIEPGLPTLNTDTLKVRQILLNLLSNAAKFTDQGAITVIARRHDGMISIAVKDDGIGIEEKNLHKIFEEFSQIETGSSRKYKGTGLGLPIARNYARLLGGDLTVQSEYGKGSTFTLIIPPVYPKEKLAKQAVETVAKKETPVSIVTEASKEKKEIEKPIMHHKGPKVLCIDDDAEVIELLQQYLEPEGYNVRGALSGDEGIKVAQEFQPAVITLDITMPQKDGWQVLRELKSNPSTKDIPVIIHSIIDNKPLALSLGALDVVTKPSEPKKILSMVEHACKTKDKPVLIVDDNEDFAESMKVILQSEGYRAVALYSGEKALNEIDQINPSMLFLDLKMPGIDGFMVVHKLRAQEKWKDLPIVILSGAEINEEQRQDLNRLTQEFIEKGQFSKEIISKTISRIIEKSKK